MHLACTLKQEGSANYAGFLAFFAEPLLHLHKNKAENSGLWIFMNQSLI